MGYEAYTDDELRQMAGSSPAVGDASDYSDEELIQIAGTRPPSGATRSFAPEDLFAADVAEERRSKAATLSNVLPDIARIGKDVWGMVTSPVQTLKGAYGLLKGGAETAARDVAGAMGIPEAETRPNTPEESAFMGVMEPVTKSIMEPETIIPRMKEYTEERPVMSLLNASLGISGLGKAAEALGATETAAMLGKTGTALNPAVIAAKGMATTARTVVPPIAKVVKEMVGAYTGRGPGFVEEMVKGGKAAEKAMRGEITGEEIVGHAKQALQGIRDARSTDYLAKLDTVRANPEQLTAVRAGAETKLRKLSDPDHFDVGLTFGEDGRPLIDFSKSTIIEHQKVVERAIQDVTTWQDNTPRGLDTLTKRLSKYESQAGRGTPAESFVTQLRNEVSNGLKRTVPEYEEMTKGYREASTLIKDIESNLMLRKEGMTGRITADQTLRRLSSAFREGFEMRKDLIRTLGTESGMDIPGEVAGYLANQWIPAGILGKGLTMGSAWALHFLNPQWWPILAASSPRVVGEFLNAYGKAVKSVKSVTGRTRGTYGPTAPWEGPPSEFPTRGFRGNERLGQKAIGYNPFIDTTPRVRAPYEYPPQLPAGQGFEFYDQRLLRAPYETPLQLEGQGFELRGEPVGGPSHPELLPVVSKMTGEGFTAIPPSSTTGMSPIDTTRAALEKIRGKRGLRKFAVSDTGNMTFREAQELFKKHK